MSNVFFTSDTHFDHANVIKYCNRPFRNKHEMNEAMIQNWNSVVKPGDTIIASGKASLYKHQLQMTNPKTPLPWAISELSAA